MNKLEDWFCATNFWRNITQQHLLPRLLKGGDRGDSVLELGPGPGAATSALLKQFERVTSLEYSAKFATKIARDLRREDLFAGHSAVVVQGDATQMPFADASFSCVVAILMLHHLRSAELQDRALAEVFRVLRPGGSFLAFEIHDGWLQQLIHARSTFVPFVASAANARLNAAGFARASVDFVRGGFLLSAQRIDRETSAA
jgi:ubiquinone/menaquinone biosynthesis C-methylase UbiE